jgi:hypothetical protein
MHTLTCTLLTLTRKSSGLPQRSALGWNLPAQIQIVDCPLNPLITESTFLRTALPWSQLSQEQRHLSSGLVLLLHLLRTLDNPFLTILCPFSDRAKARGILSTTPFSSDAENLILFIEASAAMAVQRVYFTIDAHWFPWALQTLHRAALACPQLQFDSSRSLTRTIWHATRCVTGAGGESPRRRSVRLSTANLAHLAVRRQTDSNSGV